MHPINEHNPTKAKFWGNCVINSNFKGYLLKYFNFYLLVEQEWVLYHLLYEVRIIVSQKTWYILRRSINIDHNI